MINWEGFFFPPTILADVPAEARLISEEVFGPVVYVEKFSTGQEAVRAANSVEYGLSASVWTSDLDQALRMSRLLEAGTVWVNDHLTFVNEFPHGGVKRSGFGVDLSVQAIAEFQRGKHVVVATN